MLKKKNLIRKFSKNQWKINTEENIRKIVWKVFKKKNCQEILDRSFEGNFEEIAVEISGGIYERIS